MANQVKIECFRKKSIEELQKILDDPNSTEEDIIIATIEQQDKEEELGIAVHYTTEEVLEHIFGRTNMAENS